MVPDLSPIFAQYEMLRGFVDRAAAQVAQNFPDCVTCHKGCSDCCHALFDLSLVEAMYLNRAFREKFDYGPERSALVERASRIDRQLTRMKRDFYREYKQDGDAGAILLEAAELRMPCPLLDENNACILYEARPITCRAYGIPTSIGGRGHVCGLTGFARGGAYPTLKLDRVHQTLNELSLAIERAVSSRFDQLHEVFMPVSMALITSFDENFLGIGPARRERD